jgi:5-methylcytosine-specific restriction endonuclease McrA
MTAKKTLVLTQWDSPFLIVSWKAGILMMLSGDVELVEPYGDEVVRSPSIELPLPAVVRLQRGAVSGIRRGVRFSRENIFLRDRYTCQYCAVKKKPRELNLDHVIPASKGGRKCWENIVTSCIPCNDSKRNRTPEQAGMRLVRGKPVRPLTLPLSSLELEEAKVPREWAPYAEDDSARAAASA